MDIKNNELYTYNNLLKRNEEAIQYCESLIAHYDNNIDIDDVDISHLIEILKGREQFIW